MNVETDPADIVFFSLTADSVPYLALVHGRRVHRRCNETLPQFEARAQIVQAQILTAAWSRSL